MIWVDYCIIAVFLISVVIGIARGFVREVLGIGTWVLAVWLAWAFSDEAALALEHKISDPALRLAASYAVLFLGGLLVGAITTWFVCELVDNSSFRRTDRTLGGGFGLVRASLLAAAFVLVADTMGARQDAWWQESVFVTRLEWLAQGLKSVVPAGWLEKLKPAPIPEGQPSS
ncbi:MAG TPA: CvpA family protein [Candidatus Binatia bacterium]|nr:CvpA family protein [Candidatus Binatia bacterium]